MLNHLDVMTVKIHIKICSCARLRYGAMEPPKEVVIHQSFLMAMYSTVVLFDQKKSTKNIPHTKWHKKKVVPKFDILHQKWPYLVLQKKIVSALHFFTILESGEKLFEIECKSEFRSQEGRGYSWAGSPDSPRKTTSITSLLFGLTQYHWAFHWKSKMEGVQDKLIKSPKYSSIL